MEEEEEEAMASSQPHTCQTDTNTQPLFTYIYSEIPPFDVVFDVGLFLDLSRYQTSC